MPALPRRDTFQLFLLLLVVPFQYWLTQELKQSHSYPILKTVLDKIDTCHGIIKYWTKKLWEILPENMFHNKGSLDQVDKLSDDESPAREVFEHRSLQNSMFASSTEPRYYRPPAARFRVGDVVLHKKKNLRGVVVGWDYKAQAPPEYLKEYHSKNELEQPNYLVAIDTRDRLNPQFIYTPVDHLQLLANVRIIHPNVDEYFEFYDGSKYVPRPWLQRIYPKD